CGTSAEFFPLQCNLTGHWKNDFGSNMTIYEVKESGDFAGKYLTAVAAPTLKIQESPLVGSQ
ncbi:AVID protein, partial [Irena cyanogastra]|nr:AVID protein [Irena cyanogastra]